MKKDEIKSFFEGGSKVTVKKLEKKAENKVENNKNIENPPPKAKLLVRFFDGILKVSIFMVIFGLPLFFTNLTFQGVAFEKQMYFYFWVLLGMVSWVSKGLVSEAIKIRRTPLDIPILIFWFLYLLSAIFSVDRWHSFWGTFGDPSRGLMSATALVLFYYLFMSNFSQRTLKWSVGALVASGSLLTIWTALIVNNASFIKHSFLLAVPANLFGSVISLGIFFSCMLPLLVMVIFKLKTNEKMKGLLKILLLMFLFAVLAADLFLLWKLYSVDIPWVGAFAGMILFLIFILSKIIRPSANWSWLPMTVFVALMVIPMVVPLNEKRLEMPFGSSWEIAKKSVADKFLLGSGPATFGYDFSLYYPLQHNLSALSSQRFYQGTGVIFEALPTLGALGSLPLIIIILSFISIGGYLLIKERQRDKIYSLGILIAALIIIVDILYVRFEGPVLLLSALIGTLAMAAILHESGSEEKYASLAIKASAKYALTLAFMFMVVTAGVIFLFIFIGKAYVADVYAAQGANKRSLEKFEKAIKLFGGEGRYYTRLGQEYMVLVNQEVLKDAGARNVGLIQNQLNKSIENSKKGSDLMKNDVQATEALAQIYENTGMITKNYKLAEEAYKRALELEPNNPNLYVKLGQIKLNIAVSLKKSPAEGVTDNEESKQLVGEAKDLFQKSLDMKQDFSAGYYNLALAEEALGEIDNAIVSMQKAAYFGRNVNNVFGLGRLHQARGKDNDNELAESYFKEILGVNDKEVNTHFSLGILYEKTGRKSQAVEEYEKVLALLPAELEETKTRVEKMISNIRSGVENVPENLKAADGNNIPTETVANEEMTAPGGSPDEILPTEGELVPGTANPAVNE